jgi:hypothetical protein
MTYGPFVDRCDPTLRQVYLTELRALVRVFAGPNAADAAKGLSAALKAPSDVNLLAHACKALDAFPSVPRRRVLLRFAALRREVAHAS